MGNSYQLHWRQDPITGYTVLINPRRGMRPNAFVTSGFVPAKDHNCPFCPGNESMTPPASVEHIPEGSTQWRIRVFPNKYPIVQPESHILTEELDSQTGKLSSYGNHEILVDSPEHTTATQHLPLEHVVDILRIAIARLEDYHRVHKLSWCTLFKNHGDLAGASIAHPHWQLIGLSFEPPSIKAELRGFEHYQQKHGKCYLCRTIETELETSERLLFYNDAFVVLCPFVSRFPYEIWLVPREHESRLQANKPADWFRGFAKLLCQTLQAVDSLLNLPAYNLYLVQAGNDPSLNWDSYHWRFTCLPRLTHIAGFEFATGLYVNPVAPEQAAEQLRSVITKEKELHILQRGF